MSIQIPRIWLPRTGQTMSYAAGDDGTFRAGNPRLTRFINNGNGTVSDRATGLTWVKQPELIIPGATGVHATNQIQAARGNWATGTAYAAADLVSTGGAFYVCATPHTSGTFADDLAAGKWRVTVWTGSAANLTTPAAMTWAAAVANSLGVAHGGSGLSYAGFDDWRLPNIIELASLQNWGSPTSPADFAPLVDNRSDYKWWSSNTHPTADTVAKLWTYGYSPYILNALKTATAGARPVRGGRING